MAYAGKRKLLIIVENLPVPFDRRVWQEATTLVGAGYQVSIICPKGKGYSDDYDYLEGVHIYRHPLPLEAESAVGYLCEYSVALFLQFWLTCKIWWRHGFDVIQACNPPDTIFLIAGIFKLFGKRFVFDHHDINPELYLAKFERKDFFYNLMLWLERMTFRCADISIATNQSYKKIAIERGGMLHSDVFIVRSGPNLDRLKRLPPEDSLKKNRAFLVGYVGVMGAQEGVQYLLEAARYIIFDCQRSDVHFGLVGGGTELEHLKALSVDLGISDYVTFTGRVEDSVLLAMLNTADVCVNPDVANEMNDKSTMNKIMEYMALGKPVVQFDLTEGRVSADQASLYAKPNDAIDLANKVLELLGDPVKRRQMGDFGRKRVENELAWEYEAPKLLAAYDHLWQTRFHS